MFRFFGGATLAAVVLSATSVFAASVDATSYSPTGHSVWFSSTPPGASGGNANKFLFENTVGAEASTGTFTVNGDGTATLTGIVRNAALQGFEILLNLKTAADPGVYKNGGNAADPSNDWSFWSIDDDPNNKSLLTSLNPGVLDSYRITQHGQKQGKDLAAQLGLGANDKNSDFGFSTWTYFLTPTHCTDKNDDGCSGIKGDINISLSSDPTPGVVPLPAGLFLLPAGLVMLGAIRRRKAA